MEEVGDHSLEFFFDFVDALAHSRLSRLGFGRLGLCRIPGGTPVNRGRRDFPIHHHPRFLDQELEHLGAEVVFVPWLGEEGGGSYLERFLFAGRLTVNSCDDNNRSLFDRILADPLAQFEAMQLGQHRLQNDEVVIFRLELFIPGEAVCSRLRLKAFLIDQAGKRGEGILVEIDDQNFSVVHHAFPEPRFLSMPIRLKRTFSLR
jgi:hypothetical protein